MPTGTLAAVCRFAVVGVIACSALVGCSLPSTQGPPSASPDGAGVISGQQMEGLIEAGFVAHDPDYRRQQAVFGERLHALAASLAAIQAAGNDMACSTQIYLEANWLYEYTVEWVRLDHELARLTESLRNPNQAFALRQSPETGSWGICYDEWFFRAEAALTGLEELHEEGRSPSYPIELPGRIDTPAKLKAYLDGLLVSDVEATGRDNRGELGNITTVLASALFKDYLREYLQQTIRRRRDNRSDPVPGRFESVYEDFLRKWQEPRTGYWGAWYRVDGRIYKSADLSITYHTIAYRNGQVEHWPQIIDTTLRIEKDPYPFGWLHHGHFNNHNNYDVVRILELGWPYMSAWQKRQAAEAIHEMLDWTLHQSLDADGSFKLDPTFFSSIGAEYYFGVSFLDRAGFWDREKRFWTDETFPGSIAVCRLIRTRMTALELQGWQARDSLKTLNAYCGA